MSGTQLDPRGVVAARRELAAELLEIVSREPAVQRLLARLDGPAPGRAALTGLAGSLKSAAVACLRRETGRGVLFLTPRMEDALRHAADFSYWLGEEVVRHLPDPETVPYGLQSPADEVVGERLRALRALRVEPASVVVASYPAILRLLPPPDAVLGRERRVAVGDPGEPRELAAALARRGYDRAPAVEELGQFSLRGGIVDVFPHLSEHPCRIEFGEDHVESIRRFDLATQRSLAQLPEALILPRRELLPPEGSGELAGQLLQGLDAGRSRNYPQLAEAVARASFFEGIEWYRPLFYPQGALASAYAGHELLVVLDEPHRLEEAAREVLARAHALYKEKQELRQFAFPPEALFATHAQVLAALEGRPGVELHLLPQPEEDGSYSLASHSAEPFGSNLNLVREWLRQLRDRRSRVYILCPTPVQTERIAEALGEEAGEAALGVGALSAGFGLPASGLELLTDREIYGRVHRAPRLPRFRGSGPVRDALSLARGDYVVHVHHGIGRYLGSERVASGGTEAECLVLAYDGGDRVLVPIQQLSLLEKYGAPEGAPPRLSRLGTAAWERTKTRAKKAIKEMAGELISVYAERRARPGHAFAPDTPWQSELEAAFPYDETPDQLKAADDVKQDMEKPQPMDRLVCGDVGYGKTEVAIRAAFKAVMDGRQVAVLVPTTILAQQHLATFRERIGGFPVRVEMLSRFRTPREQKRVLEELAAGRVDVVVGTHRLLSADVRFANLGLVVIDEEHRFGVGHKERLKKLRTVVDVLTLTATPIPRTLHLSLMGARDLTVMETPPPNRLTVHTEIVPFDREIISGAILHEVERGGQVFFVHNRVQSIHAMARMLRGLLPQLRIGVAHGQMSERELERAMLDFLDQRHDVLVSTMIIESGLDMPRVNTLVVNRADRLGLAQLYQLRGRVGRSYQRAYAYLLLPPSHRMTPEAEKRLAIIAESTELGSGMRLALRDLEIRGAGNVLGAEQHGFVTEIGMELYCRLLDEAVAELKGEPVPERTEVRLDTDVSALLPGGYVEDGGERVAIYRRLIRLRERRELAELDEELADRFGPLPEQAQNLLGLQRIKLGAEQAGVEEVRLHGTSLEFRSGPGKAPSRDRLQHFVREVPFPVAFAARDGLRVRVTLPRGSVRERLAAVERCLESLGTA